MSVLSANIPAIAGGRPMFDERVPIVSPEGLPGEEFLRDVRKILNSRQLTNATFVRKFEEAAEEYLGVAHCVAVSSCTAGLVLTLQALDLQGEVIVPSFTFHASAHSLLWNGLKPVFADCDRETFCIDPALDQTSNVSPHSRNTRRPFVRKPCVHRGNPDHRL